MNKEARGIFANMSIDEWERERKKLDKKRKKSLWKNVANVYFPDDFKCGMYWETDRYKFLICDTGWDRSGSSLYSVKFAKYVRENKKTNKKELKWSSVQTFFNHNIYNFKKLCYFWEGDEWVIAPKNNELYNWYEEEILWENIK